MSKRARPVEKHEDAMPTCPVCLEIPVDPLMIQCGHTICSICKPRIKECPMCKHRIVSSKLNFMFRDCLQRNFPDQYAERLQHLHSQTLDGQLQTLADSYRTLHFWKTNFSKRDQLYIAKRMDDFLKKKYPDEPGRLCVGFASSVAIVHMKDVKVNFNYYMHLPEAGNMAVLQMNDDVFIVVSKTRTLKKIPLPN